MIVSRSLDLREFEERERGVNGQFRSCNDAETIKSEYSEQKKSVMRTETRLRRKWARARARARCYKNKREGVPGCRYKIKKGSWQVCVGGRIELVAGRRRGGKGDMVSFESVGRVRRGRQVTVFRCAKKAKNGAQCAERHNKQRIEKQKKRRQWNKKGSHRFSLS